MDTGPCASLPRPGSPGALERVASRFSLNWEEVGLGQCSLALPDLADPSEYIESRVARGLNNINDLPLWTKLWPAALLLARMVLDMELDPSGPVLELGAGLGLPGLAAAQKGHRVVLTDNDPDALEFARAAVEKNRLEDLVEVRPLSWASPPTDLGRFPTVLGAEITYEPAVYPQLLALLNASVAPGGRAFISHQQRPFKIGFFDYLNGEFAHRSLTRRMRDEEGEITVFIHALLRGPAA